MSQAAMERMKRECTELVTSLWPGDPRPIVFGDGRMDEPPLMLIGEAPGQQEALLGKPFVGKAGRNLTQMLDTIALRREDNYISNVVKIRPTKRSPSGGLVNRPPDREEIAVFQPWLMREIAIVKPAALVTLGNVALHAFVPATKSIGQCHGRWQRVVACPEKGAALTLPLFALYHPASIIYPRSLADVYRADLEELARSLRLPSSRESDI